MAIEIQGGITIGNNIIIGDVPVIIPIGYFVTEDDNFLITEDDRNLIAE
jgi:hypothetical protein